MSRNAIRPGRDGDLGRVHGVGMGAAARVSDRGDVIDIDA
jgi:hypothetical protein